MNKRQIGLAVLGILLVKTPIVIGWDADQWEFWALDILTDIGLGCIVLSRILVWLVDLWNTTGSYRR